MYRDPHLPWAPWLRRSAFANCGPPLILRDRWAPGAGAVRSEMARHASRRRSWSSAWHRDPTRPALCAMDADSSDYGTGPPGRSWLAERLAVWPGVLTLARPENAVTSRQSGLERRVVTAVAWSRSRGSRWRRSTEVSHRSGALARRGWANAVAGAVRRVSESSRAARRHACRGRLGIGRPSSRKRSSSRKGNGRVGRRAGLRAQARACVRIPGRACTCVCA